MASEPSTSKSESVLSTPSRFEAQNEEATNDNNLPPFRILLGIFSVEKDKERRDLIRNTYLSFPKFLDQRNITTIPMRHARICSLDDYWHKTISEPEQCQILYTFVLGAAKEPQAPVEYLHLNPGRNMTVDLSTIFDAEADTTYLNIRENMDFGKTNTWFKYAATQLPNELDIDIIGKVDTDCIIYPEKLMDEMESRMKKDTLVYGGDVIDNDKGHHYMQGGFYFLSRVVAQSISSGRDDRWQVILKYMPSYRYKRPEDVETGQLVLAFGGPNIYHMNITTDTTFIHNKRLKEERYFQHRWAQYTMGEVIAKDHLTKIQIRHGTKCPSQDILAKERDVLPIHPANARKRFHSLVDQLVEKCQNQTLVSESLY